MPKYDKKTKTLTKRVLGGSTVLHVSDQGDLSNHESTVWRGDRRARRWMEVEALGNRAKANMVLTADAVKLGKDHVIVFHGEKATKIEARPVTEQTKVMRQPDGPSFTIDAWRAENRVIMNALHTATLKDISAPILSCVSLHMENGGVTGYSSDRFRIVKGRLETTSKPTQFEANIVKRMVRELVFARAWHLTVWEDQAIAEFCDTGVRLQTRNWDITSSKFPAVNNLFPDWSDENATWVVTPSAFAKTVQDMNPPTAYPVALSREGLIASEGVGQIKPAGVIETSFVKEPAKWIAFNHEYLSQLLRAASAYDTARIQWGPDMKPVNITVSDRLRMLLMPTRGAGRSFPVANITDF